MQKTVQTIFIVAVFVFALVAFVPFAALAVVGDVVINEIGWMGTIASPSDEWIELRNNTQSAIDLSGWTLSLLKPATTTPSKVIALFGSVPAGGFYLIERTDENTTDIQEDLISVFGTGLVDSGMILQLAQNEVVVDRTPDLCDNKWCAGSNNPKMSMERVRPDADGAQVSNWATNNGVAINGKDAAGNPINGTPKQENSVYNNPPLSPSSESSFSSVLSSSPSHPVYPALTVDAGPDKTVLVGSSVSFSGLALGINNAPLLDAWFLWNFGDGTLKETKTWEHVYYFPGAYTAALTVSSGPYSGFDMAVITAVVPALTIKNTQTGEDGFVAIANGSDAKLDLGGMILRDNTGAQFLIPKNTFIAAHGEVTFPNRVSGVLKSGGVVVLYDAIGREVREQPQTAIREQPRIAPQAEVVRVSSSAGLPGETSKGGEATNARDGIAKHKDVSAPQTETAAASSASQNTGFAVSKTSLFFGASVLVGVLSAVGFFLLKNLF